MNFRQTAVLIGSVFAVVVVLIVLTFTAEDKTPATDVLTEELVGVKADEIDAVEMDRDGARLKLVRTDAAANKWELTEPFRAAADGAAVQGVVTALMKAKPVASPELTSNPAAHGLDPAGLKVTLRKGDKSSTVNLGNVSIGGTKAMVFVTTSARRGRWPWPAATWTRCSASRRGTSRRRTSPSGCPTTACGRCSRPTAGRTARTWST